MRRSYAIAGAGLIGALSGFLVAALLVFSLPSAGAVTGDPVVLGAKHFAGKTTQLKGGGVPALKLVSTGSAPLVIDSPPGVAPMEIDSGRRVRWLNADKIDGYHAAALQERFAVVDAAGTLVRGSGVTSVDQVETGAYQIDFDVDVGPCAYLASLSSAGGGSGGDIVMTSGTAGTGSVFVAIKNGSNVLVDRAFNLHLVCPLDVDSIGADAGTGS